jgi:tetratricopeptide (TPR) repeat protein
MTKTTQILLGLMAVVLIVATAFLLYLQNIGQRDSEQDAIVLESGIALFRENKHQEAFEMLRGIPVDSPYEWRARYYQGSALIMLKNYESAVGYLEQAYALNDRETRIMHGLGVAYFKLGNLKMAKGYFAAILEIDPGDEEARGLMDIMAKLERNQSENVFPDTSAESIRMTTGKDSEGH